MKIAEVIGARPQFIKAAAFSRAIAGRHEEVLIHTGQHFDKNMSEIFFEELAIPRPAYNLGISGGFHGNMTGSMLIKIEEILLKEMPDWLLVYGDTNSTLAGALAAVKMKIPVAHVEAGGRIGDLANPEEVNRVATDHISTLLFAPTSVEQKNLEQENLGTRSHITGNIMYDSYLYAAEKVRLGCKLHFFDFDGLPVKIPKRYYYLTCHRQENTVTDQNLYEILRAMNQLDFPTIYPVHPRNRERAFSLHQTYGFSNVLLIQPVGYLESVALLDGAEKVVTDSGGLQCESFYAQKQCVTIFKGAAWPQTMAGNRNQLSRPRSDEILKKLSCQQEINPADHPFGDGHAAERICSLLEGAGPCILQ